MRRSVLASHMDQIPGCNGEDLAVHILQQLPNASAVGEHKTHFRGCCMCLETLGSKP